MSYTFIPIRTDDQTIKKIAEFLCMVFPKSTKYSEAYITWQYKNNPDGEAIGYNAYENGNIVAHYAVIPFNALVFNKHEMGVLSINTATHPNHQGKKIFTTLAELTYKLAQERGYAFVIGVANANSTPGFVNKLGFQFVGTLEAKLGFGKIDFLENNSTIEFSKIWNQKSIEWRLANPETKYTIKNNTAYAATEKPGIRALLIDTEGIIPLFNTINFRRRPMNVWIGINNSMNWKRSFYFNIPHFLRPSPLNFIFKDLTPQNRKLELNKIHFTAFDFDAY